IDNGATLRWGNGSTLGFLLGGTGLTDNGALVVDIDGGGIGTSAVISGTGSVTFHTGAFGTSATNTYTGLTTIDSAPVPELVTGGSISASSGVVDNGTFDISNTTGASITALTGSGKVSLGGQTLTLTNATGTFSGVLADGGLFGGTGGGLTIAGGTEILSGTN